MKLKVVGRMCFPWHNIHIRFSENWSVVSEVVKEDIQAGW
jgi:hypothetical protein